MWLLKLIPFVGQAFDLAGQITSKIGDLKVAQINAATEQERIKVGEQIAELEAKRAVLVAQASSPYGWITQTIQGLLGLAVVILMWKLVVWDKALGTWTGGHTDPLGSDIWDFVKIVVGFYFVTTWFRR